ncbi:MAG: hypothetical protein N838_02110 [Thiohalocapsa sp. PB-PSB1]|jgi:hypothetical protein|nr:MAG: hypothetical protein N838_02110 [Thiohalocapsa sp. PB-PSB1]
MGKTDCISLVLGSLMGSDLYFGSSSLRAPQAGVCSPIDAISGKLLR